MWYLGLFLPKTGIKNRPLGLYLLGLLFLWQDVISYVFMTHSTFSRNISFLITSAKTAQILLYGIPWFNISKVTFQISHALLHGLPGNVNFWAHRRALIPWPPAHEDNLQQREGGHRISNWPMCHKNWAECHLWHTPLSPDVCVTVAYSNDNTNIV